MRIFIGSNGGLGRTFKKYYKKQNDIFLQKDELNIFDINKLIKIIEKNKINSLINFAAYTDLQKCEIKKKDCILINGLSLNNICEILNFYKIKLYHISTDYVFSSNDENKESDKTNPKNIYGISKNLADEIIINKSNNYSIIRTSWLFNEFGNDFISKILKKIQKNSLLKIRDEYGCPTSSESLSAFINFICLKDFKTKEILHFCNYPFTSRLNFTKTIINNFNKKNNFKYDKKIELVDNFDSVTRPYKSILSCTNTLKKYNYNKKYWINDLKKIFK